MRSLNHPVGAHQNRLRDLNAEVARTFLIVDRKVARNLGIQIPQSVLVRADRVIE